MKTIFVILLFVSVIQTFAQSDPGQFTIAVAVVPRLQVYHHHA